LEKVECFGNKTKLSEINLFEKSHPNCLIIYKSTQNSYQPGDTIELDI